MDFPILQLVATSTTGLAQIAETAETQITSYLLHSDILLTVGALALLPAVIDRVLPFKNVTQNQWVVRFMPLAQMLLAFGMTWLPGALKLPNRQIGTLVVAGLWCSSLAVLGHKIIGHMILGDDPRIKTWAVISPGQNQPPPPAVSPPNPPSGS